MPRRGRLREATHSSPHNERLRSKSHPVSLCIRHCKFQSSTLAYPWLWFTARLKWMVAGDSRTFSLPVLYTKNGVNIWQPPTTAALESLILREIGAKWKRGDECSPTHNTSPSNQRFSQLIYSALERVRALWFESVAGTYKIYSNAINIIP